MKERIINYIYFNLQSYPSKELIIENLGEITNKKLVSEITKLVPLIVSEIEYITKMIKTNEDLIKLVSYLDYVHQAELINNQIRHLTKSSVFTSLESKNEYELIEAYQYLFRIIIWLGITLIELKNEIVTSKNKNVTDVLLRDVYESLNMLNNIIDISDYITSLDAKQAMNISDDTLPYIKQRNILWIIDNTIDKFERHAESYRENPQKFTSYFRDVRDETLNWRKNYGFNYVTEKDLLDCYRKAQKLLNKINSKLEKSESDYQKFQEIVEQANDFETDESELRLPGIFGFAKFMIDWANEVQEQDAREKAEKLEKQMDNYLLEEWQKELVRKGEYDPWSFEEEGELEEGDYYYEDDR